MKLRIVFFIALILLVLACLANAKGAAVPTAQSDGNPYPVQRVETISIPHFSMVAGSPFNDIRAICNRVGCSEEVARELFPLNGQEERALPSLSSAATTFESGDICVAGQVVATEDALGGLKGLVSTGSKTGVTKIGLTCIFGFTDSCRTGVKGEWCAHATITLLGIRNYVTSFTPARPHR